MPINIDQEIAKIDSEVLALQGRKASLTSSRDSWQKDADVKCDQIIKAKKDECLRDKAWKASNAANIQTQINGVDELIRSLNTKRQSFLDQKASENRQAEILASQGMSSGALLVKAEAEGKAIQTIAEAQAKTVSEISESSNQRKNIIIAVVVIVVVIAGILVYKKFKNKK